MRTIHLFPLQHPAATFAHRSPELLPLLALDFRKFVRVWRGELVVPEVQWRACHTALDLTDWFNTMPAGRIALDLEWSRQTDQLVCIGVGGAGHYALVPFVKREGWQLGASQRADICTVLQMAFDDPARQWGGHFVVGYDERKLHECGMRLRAAWDSLYAFHLCFTELGSQRDEEAVERSGKTGGGKPTGYDLGFVSTVLTCLPYHKGVVTHDKDALAAPTEQLHEYCIGDVARSWLSMEALALEMQAMLGDRGWRLLERDMECARRAALMGIAGVPIRDAERKRLLREWQDAENTHARQAADAASSASFNPRSPKQLAAVLEAQGVRVERNRRTGLPKLDGRVLERLQREYPTIGVLREVAQVRAAQKEQDAYKAMEPSADGNAHPNYKVHGTSGSRWSSTPNFQNLSHEQRKVIG